MYPPLGANCNTKEKVNDVVKKTGVLIFVAPTVSTQIVDVVRERVRVINSDNRIVICKLPEYEIIKEL